MIGDRVQDILVFDLIFFPGDIGPELCMKKIYILALDRRDRYIVLFAEFYLLWIRDVFRTVVKQSGKLRLLIVLTVFLP